jgi:hypothetical protein
VSTALVPGKVIAKDLKSLLLWGHLQEKAAASFIALLCSNRSLQTLSMTVTENVCLHALGIDKLFQQNTSLRQFDLVIVGAVKNVEMGVDNVTKAFAKSRSVKSLRILTAGGNNLITKSLKQRVSQNLYKKDIELLNIFGVEW